MQGPKAEFWARTRTFLDVVPRSQRKPNASADFGVSVLPELPGQGKGQGSAQPWQPRPSQEPPSKKPKNSSLTCFICGGNHYSFGCPESTKEQRDEALAKSKGKSHHKGDGKSDKVKGKHDKGGNNKGGKGDTQWGGKNWGGKRGQGNWQK